MAGRLAGLWDEVLDDVHAPGATLVDGILRRTEARAAALYVWDGRRWFLRASAGDPEGGVPRILLHSAPSAKAARHRRGGGVWSAGAWGVHVALRVWDGPAGGGEASSAAPHGPFSGDGEEEELRLLLRLAACGEAHLRRRRERDPERDPLTGLLAPQAFRRRLEEEIARALRLRQPLALVRFSVRLGDRPPDVRRSFEPEVARILRGIVRASDVAGRDGPEEFLLLLPGSDSAGAERVAVRASARIRQAAARLLGEDAAAVSAGVGDLPADGDDAASLSAAADHALYMAQTAGGNCVRVSGAGGRRA